jgi:hypothetical protein
VLSILTATFNRSPDLRRCFASLLAQSSLEFEWVVVDDGSSDDTLAQLDYMRRTAPFHVEVASKGNGGKHTALNLGVPICRGEFVLILDSDDELLPHGVATLIEATTALPSHAVGLIGNLVDHTTGSCLGTPIPPSIALTTGNGLYQMKVRADTFRAYRSSLLRSFPFPVVPGERFMPENVVWDAIDGVGPMRVVHAPVVRCTYQPDGLSSQVARMRRSSPRGFAMSLESSAWATPSRSLAIKRTVAFQIWCRVHRRAVGHPPFRRKAMWLVCLPISSLLFKLKRPSFLFS